MILTEAERRLDRIDQDREQPVAVAADGGFILDPGGMDRGAGPEDHDQIRALERPVDLR